MFGKSRLALVVAEFFGAAALTATVLSVNNSNVGLPYFIAIGMGITVAVMLLAVGSVKDVSFNPALTVGMWSARKIGTISAILAIAAQLFGGFAAWQLFEYLTETPLRSLATSEFDVRVFAAEVLGTFALGLAVAAALYYKYEGTKLAAVVGGGLFLGIMLASLGSNGVVNPAVALGIQSWNVAYVTGPIVGAVVAINLYGMLFAPSGSFSIAGLGAAKVSTSKPVSTKQKVTSKTKATAKKPVAKKSATMTKKKSAKKPASRKR